MPNPDLTWDDPEFDDAFENFVGRLDKLSAFRENFTGERPKWMVLSITGEGGVGKSTLLKQFMRLAQGGEIKANLVYSDDKNMTPVEVMGFVAEELAKLKIKHASFDERYAKYRQLREEAEKDPNIPTGFFDLGAHVVTDIAMDAISSVPGLGLVSDPAFKKSAGGAFADAGKYLLSRWSNKDEVLLLREPEKTLTPLFLELLNQAAEKKRLVVMLDVFERTARLLSPWLLDILAAPYKYGKLSAWVSFVVSGRDALSQRWTELGKRVVRLALEPFESNETREYLLNRGIADETLIEQIHKDTGGLPVLVELLAGTNPKPGQPLPDISEDAVERFLQWTPAELRQVPLLAAIPRQFNKDILVALLGDDGAAKFDWLVEQSYIRSDTERGWFYHERVRALMLRYLANRSPQELSENHYRLAGYFANLQAGLELPLRASYKNEIWRLYEAERFYHLFSVAPEKNWSKAIHSFLLALHHRWRFSARILNLIKQVIDEARSPVLDQDVKNLESLFNAYEQDDNEQVINQLNKYEKTAHQEISTQVAFYSIRGIAYSEINKNEKALTDFDHIIKLDKKNPWAFAHRGEIHRWMKKHQLALADFNRAIDLDEQYVWAITKRGQTYRNLSQIQNAIKDFNRALEIDENNRWARENRCDINVEQGNYKAARDDILTLLDSDTTDINNYAKYIIVMHKEQGDRCIESTWIELDSLLELGAKKINQKSLEPDAKKKAAKVIWNFLGNFVQTDDGIQKVIDEILGECFDCLENESNAYREALIIAINFQILGQALPDKNVTLSRKCIQSICDSLEKMKIQKYADRLKKYLPDNIVDVSARLSSMNIEERLRMTLLYQLFFWLIRDYSIISNLLIIVTHVQDTLSKIVDKNQYDDLEFLYDENLIKDSIQVIRAIDDKFLENISLLLQTQPDISKYHVHQAINYLYTIKNSKKLPRNYMAAFILSLCGDYFGYINRNELALVLFNKSIEFDKNYAGAITQRGLTYRQMKRYEEALIDFDRAIQLGEKYAWPIAQRGVTYRQMGKYAEALVDFDRAIELDEKYAWAITHRGVTYRLMEKYAEALADFDRAIQLDEKMAWAIANRGLTYQNMGRYAEALPDFDRAIALDEKYAWAIANRGETHQDMGNYAEALADFDRAIQLDEKMAWAIASRGTTFRLIGKYHEAMTDFERVIALEPDNGQWIWQRGTTYREMKRYSEALADLNYALKLDPSNKIIHFSLGETYRMMRELNTALDEFTKYLETGKTDISVFTKRAWVYQQLGDMPSASKDIESAISLECKDEGDHYNRGVAFILSGKVKEALAELEISFTDLSCRIGANSDDLLDPIHHLPEFQALLAKYDTPAADQ
jgi:tetratricopeptide (TPR) repeat protein